MKEAPHDIQMPQQAKSSQMSASINKGKKKIQDPKLFGDLKMGKNLRPCLVPSIFQNPDFQIFYNPKSRIQEFPCTCLVAPKIKKSQITYCLIPMQKHACCCFFQPSTLLLLPCKPQAIVLTRKHACKPQSTVHNVDMEATVNSSQF